MVVQAQVTFLVEFWQQSNLQDLNEIDLISGQGLSTSQYPRQYYCESFETWFLLLQHKNIIKTRKPDNFGCVQLIIPFMDAYFIPRRICRTKPYNRFTFNLIISKRVFWKFSIGAWCVWGTILLLSFHCIENVFVRYCTHFNGLCGFRHWKNSLFFPKIYNSSFKSKFQFKKQSW